MLGIKLLFQLLKSNYEQTTKSQLPSHCHCYSGIYYHCIFTKYMKTLLSVRIAEDIKTNLQTEADALHTTLSRHVSYILQNYESNQLPAKTSKATSKSNLPIRTSKNCTKATK